MPHAHQNQCNLFGDRIMYDDSGANAGDFVTFSGAAALGGSGNIIAAVLNQEYEIATIATVNSYTITAKDTSGSTVTANANDSGNGGSSVVGKYQVNIGTDTFLSGTGWCVNGGVEGSVGSSSSL